MLDQSLATKAQGRSPAAAKAKGRKGSGRLLPVRLGEYELFDHIGRGGMADIYRARRAGDFGVVRELCIKEVLPELRSSERLAGLLSDEAKLAAKLDHANVVRIEDLRVENETLFIAMEFVDGLDLRELLRGSARKAQRIPAEVSLFVVIEMLRALDYAHCFAFDGGDGAAHVGIVHRDVSPSNVLLSFEGEVKLCDFGIARSYEGLDDRSQDAELASGMVEGKAGYMSPEQARGEPLDGRADVFAAGIILWELLSGRKLYKAAEGESLFEVARRAAEKPLPELGLPFEHELRRIVERALARNREDRYPSARAMLDEVESYAVRTKLTAGSTMLRTFLETHFAPATRDARRRRELATAALALGPAATISERAPLSAVETPPAATVRKAVPRAEPSPKVSFVSRAGLGLMLALVATLAVLAWLLLSQRY